MIILFEFIVSKDQDQAAAKMKFKNKGDVLH